MDDNAWKSLVKSIVRGDCIPILGAGIGVPHLHTGAQVARLLARDFSYPFNDADNLARVTQYIATTLRSPANAKDEMLARLPAMPLGEDVVPDNYRRLADLRLPIYVTTNYDDFLCRALPAQPEDPVISRWHAKLVKDYEDYEFEEPTPDAPLAFFMHGHMSDVQSVLVTEDDYVDFTLNMATDNDQMPTVIPHQVTEALCWKSLLFVGYSLEDVNFRVLMRSVMRVKDLRSSPGGLSIQLAPDDEAVVAGREEEAKEFLRMYLEVDSINLEWRDAGEFLAELSRLVREARGESDE